VSWEKETLDEQNMIYVQEKPLNQYRKKPELILILRKIQQIELDFAAYFPN